eukprot:2706342-Pyramimonas_sp.AAC.2
MTPAPSTEHIAGPGTWRSSRTSTSWPGQWERCDTATGRCSSPRSHTASAETTWQPAGRGPPAPAPG